MAAPEGVQKYLELSELRRRMKLSYEQQDAKLREAADALRPQVQAWVLAQPKAVVALAPTTPEEQARFGSSGKLVYHTKDEFKALSYSILHQNNRMFFTEVLRERFPQVPPDVLNQMASLCTDYCWVNRHKVVKEELIRVYDDDQKKRAAKYKGKHPVKPANDARKKRKVKYDHLLLPRAPQ